MHSPRSGYVDHSRGLPGRRRRSLVRRWYYKGDTQVGGRVGPGFCIDAGLVASKNGSWFTV